MLSKIFVLLRNELHHISQIKILYTFLGYISIPLCLTRHLSWLFICTFLFDQIFVALSNTGLVLTFRLKGCGSRDSKANSLIVCFACNFVVFRLTLTSTNKNWNISPPMSPLEVKSLGRHYCVAVQSTSYL